MIQAKDLFKKEDKDFNIDEIIDGLFNDKDIKDFIINNNLTTQTVRNGLSILLKYQGTMREIRGGKRECVDYPGYKMVLYFKYGKIMYTYERVDGTPLLSNKMIQRFGYPKEYMDANFEDIQLNTEDRRKVYTYAKRFIDLFGSEDAIKGMYLSGVFRTGKTYIASAIGNEIAKRGYSVIEAYYPELSSMLKGSFNDNSFRDIVEELKNCDLLILDDFGGESLNITIRDEALGPTLQYKMVKKKAIIITSNIPLSKITDMVLRKDGSEIEKTKALRIHERIKELTTEFMLTDRYNQEDKGDY